MKTNRGETSESDNLGKTQSPGRVTIRKRKGSNRDLTKGSIPRHLWYLSWPQMAESFFSIIDQLADLFWAGRVGYKAIAGLGVSQTYTLMLMSARMGLDAGMRAMISRAVGAGDLKYANHILFQAITLTMIWSLVVGSVGIIFADQLLSFVGVSDEVVELASMYMKLQFIGMSLMSFQRLSGGALQAAGDSVTPLKAATVSRVGHLLLSPFLIFGWGFFPEMNLAGAAAANILAQLIGVCINFIVLFKGSSRLKLVISEYDLDFNLSWRLLRIGFPAAVTGLQRSGSQLVLLMVVSSFGDAPAAAFALTRRTENVVNHTSRGLGRAAGTLSAQNLGAGNTARAKLSLSWSIVYAAILSVIAMGVLWVFSEEIAALFSDSNEFISHASLWIVILAFATFPMSCVQIFTQGIANTGATLMPMVITLLTFWIIEVPLGFGLSYLTTLDAVGVAWAIVIGNVIRSLMLYVYFLRGSWLKTGII